jgi:transcriptional regulator with XRE-family HTH domain
MRLQKAFNGMSLPDIAERLGENYSSFWNWTAGRTQIPNLILARLARMNVNVNWLLTGEGQPLAGRNLPSFEEVLDERIREIVRAELASMASAQDDLGGEVGPIEPADQIAVPHLGTVDGGEHIEEVRTPRRRKTG